MSIVEQKIADRLLERAETGKKKYGVTMEREDLSFLDWLTHLQEEVLDAAVYIEKLKGYAEEAERARKRSLGE